MANLIVLQQDSEHVSPFDAIRRFDENGNEFWTSRELMPLLGYRDYKRMKDVLSRARFACQNTGNPVAEHFRAMPPKMSQTGRPKEDVRLSRYGAYLTSMNGDPRKPEVAAAQSYFAVKTYQAEINDVSSNVDVKLQALEDANFMNGLGKILIEAGVDPLLVAGHVLTQCSQKHPALGGYFESMKMLLPQQKSLQSDEILLTPTAVGEKFDPPIKPRQVNKILLDLELQQLTGESQPRYKLTDKGKTFGKVVLNQGKNAGKTVQQVLWYPSVVDAIEDAI